MTADTLLALPQRILLSTTLHGDPVAQGSMFAVTRGAKTWLVADNDKTLRPWRLAMTMRFRAERCQPELFNGPVAVAVCFAFRIPASAPKSWRAMPRYEWAPTTADVDKACRALLDALTGTVLTNDARVVRLVAEKRYASHPACPLRQPGISVVVETAP